jgi:uncharacterized repeat protein (TIGR01451 family)
MRNNWLIGALLSILMITSLAVFSLAVTQVKFVEASPGGGSVSENVLPVDDAEVFEGNPNSNRNEYNFWVGYNAQDGYTLGGGGYLRTRVFLKFDLRRFNPNAVIENAFLRVYNKYGPSNGEPPFNNTKWFWLEVRKVENDNWSETTITWNNSPGGPGGVLGDVLDSVYIDNAFGDPGDWPTGAWPFWSFNVKPWIENQLKGDQIVSLCLKGVAETDDNVVWFYSKDAYETQPRVHLYLKGENLYPPYAVEIDVPRYVNDRVGLLGGTLTYEITVRNLGTENDNINLTVVDNLGWSIDLSENKLWVESKKDNKTTLKLTIPSDAPYRITDNITITATSEGDPTKSASIICTAYSATWISPPEADVVVVENKPDTNYGERYYMYVGSSTTEFKNERTYIKFDLSNGLPLNYTIENARLYLYCHAFMGAAGKSVQIYGLDNDDWSELAVTWNAQPGGGKTLLDTVPLMGRGWVSWDVKSFVQSQRAIDNIVSFMLRAENESLTSPDNFSYGFYAREPDGDITQRPYIAFWVRPAASYFTENHGFPGENVVVNAVIQNRGAVADNYDVTIASQSGWTVNPSATVLSNVQPGENRVVPVTVTIPSGATPRTWENLILTVTSKVDNAYSSSVTDYGVYVGFQLDMVAGWNLVGFVGVDETDKPDNIMPAGYTMYYWTAPGGPYKRPFGYLPVGDNLGYWVKVDQDWWVRTGVPPANRTIYLVAGWNLVHFPVTSASTTPNNLFAGTTYTMYYWTAPGGPYKRPFGDQPVQLGVGYWVKLDSNKTVTVPL